jgi:RNA recognition motif-containing protein
MTTFVSELDLFKQARVSLNPEAVRKEEDKRKCFIGNLAPWTNEKNLRRLFSRVGEVLSWAHSEIEKLKVIVDKATGQSKGYGFVVYNDFRQAKRAIAELDGEVEFLSPDQSWDGRPIRVRAVERQNAPALATTPSVGKEGMA